MAFFYEVIQIFESNPLNNAWAELSYSLYVRDKWARDSDPFLQYKVHDALIMAGVIEGFRSALIGANPMPWDLIIPGAVSSLVIFVSGALYFRRRERFFADIF